MTADERDRCLRLLACTRENDLMAYEQLTLAIASHYRHMIAMYRSFDSAIDDDDLHQSFRLGIWHAIDDVDVTIGDPLFYLAQQGQFAVRSLLRVIKRRHCTSTLGSDGEPVDGNPEFVTLQYLGTPMMDDGRPQFRVPDLDSHIDPEQMALAHSAAIEARQKIIVMAEMALLTVREKDVLTHLCMDPLWDEANGNRRLAAALSISEQRASLLRKRVITKLGQGDKA